MKESRRSTRSQVAPDWNSTDALTLVNEIAAIEADCLKALSSFQKWKIIAQNCNAMGVSRPLDQCRRKWDALILEYKSVKQWESKSRRSNSYWDLEVGRRKRNGLPESFDLEVFRAIDSLVRARENQSDTEPDTELESDREAEAEADDDEPDVVAEPEPKRRRGRSTPQRCQMKNSVKRVEVEKAEDSHAEEKPEETHAEENPVRGCLEVVPHKSPAEEKPQKSPAKKKQKHSQTKQEAINNEEQEQNLAMKLHETAALIRAIVAEKPDHEAAGVKSTGDLHTDFVRRQGDQIIACLGDIVKTLDQLRHLTQECE